MRRMDECVLGFFGYPESDHAVTKRVGLEKLGVKRAVSLLFLALFASLFVPVFRLKRALAAAP